MDVDNAVAKDGSKAVELYHNPNKGSSAVSGGVIGSQAHVVFLPQLLMPYFF